MLWAGGTPDGADGVAVKYGPHPVMKFIVDYLEDDDVLVACLDDGATKIVATMRNGILIWNEPMEDKDTPTGVASEWQPITNKCDLAVLGKFGEELSECTTSIFRCIIQGMNEAEPTTGKINKHWLEDEVADVLALLAFALARFNLDKERINARVEMKRRYKEPWFASLAKLDNIVPSGATPIDCNHALYGAIKDKPCPNCGEIM